jgi:hypothetical protein
MLVVLLIGRCQPVDWLQGHELWRSSKLLLCRGIVFAPLLDCTLELRSLDHQMKIPLERYKCLANLAVLIFRKCQHSDIAMHECGYL